MQIYRNKDVCFTTGIEKSICKNFETPTKVFFNCSFYCFYVWSLLVSLSAMQSRVLNIQKNLHTNYLQK